MAVAGTSHRITVWREWSLHWKSEPLACSQSGVAGGQAQNYPWYLQETLGSQLCPPSQSEAEKRRRRCFSEAFDA